ncbi:uncharacterized protein [Choristoneura fumiferana]|uniref:uncharacterized protein n=1 Tax=Choristoneura fumiferana TaxID=7141 RepID=UPI003D159698
MNKRVRKLDPLVTCFVPTCKNTVIKNRKKHFFHVPRSSRVQWCAAVNKTNVPKTGSLYICEDHLNLEEALLNYQDWMDQKTNRPRLNPQVPNYLMNINKDPRLLPSTSTSTVNVDPVPNVQEKGVLCIPGCSHKSIQVKPTMVNRLVGARIFRKRKLLHSFEEESSEGHDPSTVGSTTEFSENESSSNLPIQKSLAGRSFMLSLIEKKPFSYIGVPKQYYWIIQYIAKELKIPSLHIIITFYKLKNNETFAKIKDLFEISLTTLWRIFNKSLKALSLFFRQVIYWPTALNIKRNLPTAFTTSKEYANVQAIIDCFEIEIEKPKKPVDQALTWSQYKNCNTIKYLISATPDGFINFVSEGYGGRISDMYLVEQSGYLEIIPANATILADRGFKHLESHLVKKSVKVLRPPSVLKGTKMTKAEVIDSKILASLRIHIERVIRRVRLIKMLKPHAVVNNKLLNILDDAVVVACGLINLQSPVIRKY